MDITIWTLHKTGTSLKGLNPEVDDNDDDDDDDDDDEIQNVKWQTSHSAMALNTLLSLRFFRFFYILLFYFIFF